MSLASVTVLKDHPALELFRSAVSYITTCISTIANVHWLEASLHVTETSLGIRRLASLAFQLFAAIPASPGLGHCRLLRYIAVLNVTACRRTCRIGQLGLVYLINFRDILGSSYYRI